MIPGPPFVFGSLLVMCALLVSVFIPENVPIGTDLRHKQIGKLNYYVNHFMLNMNNLCGKPTQSIYPNKCVKHLFCKYQMALLFFNSIYPWLNIIIFINNLFFIETNCLK